MSSDEEVMREVCESLYSGACGCVGFSQRCMTAAVIFETMSAVARSDWNLTTTYSAPWMRTVMRATVDNLIRRACLDRPQSLP